MPRSATFLAGAATVLVAVAKLIWLARSEVHERQGAFVLLRTVLSNLLLIRFLILGAGLLVLPFVQARWATILIALALVAGECLGRYLFFVSVVPTNIATEYLSAEAA
jgi:DMSO reductase anchor subunit